MSYRSSTTVLTKKIDCGRIQGSDGSFIKRQFYGHVHTKREDRVNAGHFQLLRNVKTVSPYDVYFAVEQGVALYNAKSRELPEVIVRETSPGFSLTVFDCFKENLVFGSLNGKIYLYSMAKGSFIYRGFEIAKGESMIVNYLQFIKGQG